MYETYDSYGTKVRVRHLVLKGTRRTLCGVTVLSVAPDGHARPIQQCRACSRRVKEALLVKH